MIEAFPYNSAPRFLLRDRDSIYGGLFHRRIERMGIEQIRAAPRSPWQKPFVERVIGSIRRECLDHVVVLGERHLRRILNSYFEYYNDDRTHLSLDKDAPNERVVEAPELGEVVAKPMVGGLHHRYSRKAA